jgi:ABC-2 type transport system ATP-binding protein
MGDRAPVLTCDGLVRRFGDLVAVDGVTFRIEAGETYGLLGPNGAGKTTTISIVAGILAADAGTVSVAGEPMHPSAMAAKRHLGLVPQDLAVYPDLTARENLRFFARIQGLAGSSRTVRVDEVLDVIGLRDRADDRVGEFSGGMKRRLNIGVGLLHRPHLLILDEPTVGVDPQSRNAILDAVEVLAGEGMGVLYTTHYMEEAQRLCDQIGIVDRGRLIAEGTTAELVGGLEADEVVRLRVPGATEAALAALAAHARPTPHARDPHDIGMSVEGDTVVLVVDDAPARLPTLLSALAAADVVVAGIEVRRPDLEDVFLQRTGRALRD